MKGILGYVGWIYVLSLGATALAQSDPSAPPAATGGEAARPPQPSAAGSPAVSARAAASVERAPAYDADDGDALSPDLEFDEALRWRAQNTWHGPTGGVRIVDGGSGPAGTARLQFGFDYFGDSDYLFANDKNEALGGILSLSVSPIAHLEAFASLSTKANANDLGDPVLLQVAGDIVIGAKGYDQVLPWLGVGGDVRFMLLNTIGDLGVILDGTSIGFRAAATADMRRIEDPLPIIVRANLEYLLDNSSQLVEGVETARYELLSPATRKPIENEDRHLVTRIERFALGINRVDMVSVGLGVEAPFQVLTDFYLHPLLEWRLGIPVNRQGYSCLAVTTSSGIDGDDGCLAIEGLAAAPSTITLGLRVLPPLRGLSALLAFDIGVLGTGTFVRELAPNRPWSFMLALSYAIDARTPEPQIQYVQAPAKPAPAAATEKTRIRGTVVERGFGTAIVGAIVRYPDLPLSPQLTSGEGRFVSYQLEPGPVTLEITHPDYDPARCSAEIPQPQAAPAAPKGPDSSGLQPIGPQPPAASTAAGSSASALLDLRCELTARPRSGAIRGTLSDDKGTPVPGLTVEISGPSPQTVVADSAGSFTLSGLPIGDYVARVDAPAYLLKSQQFSVTTGGEASLQLTLVPKPKDAAVTLTAREVKIRDQIMFKSSSAEIDERSTGLLSEIADVLLRNPQAGQVQVQGHTDNVGDPEANLALSQQRAEAVVQWLVGAGVGADRLEAKGFGDTRPIVPNLTPGNRARNRRVQFIVKGE